MTMHDKAHTNRPCRCRTTAAGLLMFLGAAMFFFTSSCTKPQSSLAVKRQAAIERSPRFHDGSFRGDNGKEVLDISFSKTISTAWRFLFTGTDRTPDTALPVTDVDLAPFTRQGRDHLSATWLGHSSLMINIDGYRILTDPVFEKSISIVGPSRFNGRVPLNVQQVPEVDVVVISHDHYDHLNRFSIRALAGRTGLFLTPLGVGAHLESWGVPPDKIVELDWWEHHRVDGGLTLVATPAQHFSGRGLTDRNTTLWASWCILTPSKRVFFTGDSGYFDGFKQIGEQYGPFDMTFMECGAYSPHWHPVHMYPEETLQAHRDLKGGVLHPIHWGTFNLSMHPWYDPMQRITAAAEAAGVSLATPVVGETTVLGKPLPSRRWWEGVLRNSPPS
jgi:L-ascorbate metabolism protein UlaG (beta-lactamase superfamily)